MILSAVATVGWLVGLVSMVFSIACGLYFISEWTEEYPRQTRKAIQYMIWAIGVLHILMVFDGISLWRLAASFCINIAYVINLKTFPVVDLLSVGFLGSCVLAIGNHFVWFFYFIKNIRYPFGQVCGFMFFCVWLVPISLFISLIPKETSLPSTADPQKGGKKSRQNIFKSLFSRFKISDEQSLHTE